MRKEEAKKLIGKRVYAWTASWGEYIGTLVKITNNRPFRAIVRVEEVVRLPTLFEWNRLHAGKKQKFPFPEGKLINVGAVSIKPVAENEPKLSYVESLREAVIRERDFLYKWLEQAQRLGKNSDIYLINRSFETLREIVKKYRLDIEV